MFRTYTPVLACVALAIGGCGGDDDGSSPGGSNPPAEKRLTKTEYVAQANRICKDTEIAQETFDDRIDKLDRGDLPAAAPILEDALETTREGYDRLKALSPPAADQAQVDAYLAAVQRLLTSLDKLTAAARDDDRAAGRRAVAEGEKHDDEQEPLAERLGIDNCVDVF